MIFVFGSMNIDIVMPVDHFPKPGETVPSAADYLSRTGGKGANQAVAAVRAGAKVAMVGKVGDDAFGRRSINNLKSQSIWTSGIAISERPTGCATIAVDRHGANMVMTAPGANLDATSDQLPDEVFSSKNIILVQMETMPAETLSVLSRAKQGGATSIFNASPAAGVTEDMVCLVDYVIVNEIEALQLAQELGLSAKTPEELAHALSSRANNVCIITLEEKGSIAVKDGALYRQAPLPVEVVDTTGAGDAFCGIFAACLQAGQDWLAALRHASVGASLSCLGLSAQAGMPFLEDITTALEKVPAAEKIS